MSQDLLSGWMVRNARVAMTRGVLAGGLSGLLFCAGLAVAQDQTPPLAPPALDPPPTGPASVTPRPRSASGSSSSPASIPTTKPAQAAPAESRPLLIIPGVTAPVPSRPGTRPNRPRSVAGTGSADSTAPAAPSTSRASSSPLTELPAAGRDPSMTGRAPIPLTLESIPDEPPAELGSERLPADRPAAPRPPRASSPRPLSESEPSAPAASRPAPPRSSSTMFGRLLGPTGSSDEPAGPRSSITVEPRSDPAADAAVKRRIEKQVQQAVGDRVRSVEIRVSGRSVVIRAQAARFWQRRGVRRSLETMPLPSGYRARVEMID